MTSITPKIPTCIALACAVFAASCGAQSAEPIRVATTTGATTAGPHADDSATSNTPIPSPPTSSPPTSSAPGPAPPPERLEGHFVPEIVGRFAHDENAWTQGLEWYDGRLLESTGLHGESSLRLVDPETGEIELLVPIDDELYAEGATMVGDRAFQLTYTEATLLVTDLARSTPDVVGPQLLPDAYEGEGWGLCYDGRDLVMSNGTNQLRFRDTETFESSRTVEVELQDQAIGSLNELECVGDQVLANVWLTTTIVVINPETGEVEASIDASSLTPPEVADNPDAVMNGIAYNPQRGTYWLTGKWWPVVYEVTFAPA